MTDNKDRRTNARIEHTVEELTTMSDPDFRRVVTNDMFAVSAYMGPFQDRRVVERTLAALIDWLWWTNQKIDERAEDPECTPELFQKTLKYRQHLLSVIDLTERRVAWLMGTKERQVRQWKAVLHSVVEAIVEGRDDDEILAIQIPSFRAGEQSYDLETWFDIRLEKDPSRMKEWMKEAA